MVIRPRTVALVTTKRASAKCNDEWVRFLLSAWSSLHYALCALRLAPYVPPPLHIYLGSAHNHVQKR
jgi:hypothetical protein